MVRMIVFESFEIKQRRCLPSTCNALHILMREEQSETKVPRELIEIFTNSTLVKDDCSLRMRSMYYSLLRVALISELVLNPTSSSSTNSRLFAVTRRRSGQKVCPVMIDGQRKAERSM